MSELIPQNDAFKSVSTLLMSKGMQAQLRLALPKHVTPERLARIVLTEIRRTPALLLCSRESLLGAIIQAAQLGLEPGVLGECWIIPYGKEAQFVPGYRGLAQLAWRSDQVASLAARAVFDGDVFAYDYGTDFLSHKPCGESDPAKLTHAYSVIHIKGGGRIWDVMTRAEVDRIRSRSAAGSNGPWVTDYVEMSKKSVFRRLSKLAPLSAELRTAISLADSADSGLPQGLDFSIPDEPEQKPEERDVTPAEPADAGKAVA